MIYTNNQGPVEWANYIMKYFEKNVTNHLNEIFQLPKEELKN